MSESKLGRSCARKIAAATLALSALTAAHAGGPIGIDHRLNFDDSGIWKRRNQVLLQEVTPLVVLAGALWEGDDTRLGHASWQSIDSMLIGTVTAAGLKLAFGRSRPTQTDDPNRWFQGKGHNSFPSGEVMEITTAVTPFILEYGHDYPAVYALELLPLYDAVARVKLRAHWQSDVLASFLIGTAIGAYTHSRASSLTVGVLPRGVTIGWKHSF
ncbi:MAG: phosphatase PAP2 family protein [Caldimonas sp.]